MRPPKKKLAVVIIIILTISIITSVVIHNFYTTIQEKMRYENIIGIKTAITVYTNEYDGTFPEFDQWCDRLTAEADCAPKSFQGLIDPQQGVCGYALNENLKGLKFSQLDDKTVLAFEAKGPWNLTGGPELMKKTKQKNIAVVFIDGDMDFVTIKEIDNLKWKTGYEKAE